MLSLEQLKSKRTFDMVDRMQEAMIENYFGGDTITVKNAVIQEGDEYGLKTQRVHQWFTVDELRLIEKENILDEIRKDGWQINVHHSENDFNDVQWVFTGGKEVKPF